MADRPGIPFPRHRQAPAKQRSRRALPSLEVREISDRSLQRLPRAASHQAAQLEASPAGLLHDSNRINRDSSLSAIGTAARPSSSGFYSCRFDRWRHWRWSFGLRRNFKRSRRNDGFESGKSSARFRQPGFTRASSHYPDPPRRRPATGRGYRCDRGRRDRNSSPRRFRFRPAFRRWIHQPRRGIFSTGAPFRRSNL